MMSWTKITKNSFTLQLTVVPQDYVILADMFNQGQGLGLSSQTLTFF